MSLLVSKSAPVVVRPSEPVTAMRSTIQLSPLDRFSLPYTALLQFEHPIGETAETIKKALSQALVHYYPISGRITLGAGDGGSYIDCTGEGVEFIAASADCSLKEVQFYGRSSGAAALLDELAVYYPAGSYGPADPLLSLQVTEFSCGGFVLGVTWSHAIADGVGIGQFIRAVGELARGMASPSVVPVRWDDAISRLSPPFNPAREAVLMSLPPWFDPARHSLGEILEPLPLVALDATVPLSLINRVKAEFPSRFNARPCTTFEVALAVLWRCRTRAIMPSADTPSFLAFTANVRKHVGAKDGYYGNCIVNKLVMAARSSTVANADVVDLVKMIQRSKDELPEQFKKNESRDKELLQGLDGRYNMVLASSWRNLGFEEADFGSGPPARVMCHVPGMSPLPFCVMGLRHKGLDDGANVLSFCVKEEHADALLGEIARLT